MILPVSSLHRKAADPSDAVNQIRHIAIVDTRALAYAMRLLYLLRNMKGGMDRLNRIRRFQEGLRREVC